MPGGDSSSGMVALNDSVKSGLRRSVRTLQFHAVTVGVPFDGQALGVRFWFTYLAN